MNRGLRVALESSSDLSRAGVSAEVPLEVGQFVGSVGLLAWAKENGCQWIERTFALAAEEGSLDVVQWARANWCPWDARTCRLAARGGQLEMLKWLREHGCPWDGGCAHTPHRAGTWRCCSGRGSTVASGTG